MSVKREKRLSRILALLDEQERVDVEELAQFFEVSPETIRRDLSAMSEQGLLRKIYGGAVKFQSAQESPFALRTQQYAAQKTSIAQYATRFVKPGDSLFLNAGTTTTIFARELVKQVDELIIVTNSPQIAHEFYNNGQSRNKIHLIGGTYNGAEIETLGSTVIAEMQRFRMDHAFITVGTISASMGYMDYRVEAADVTRTMVSRAQRATVLADSSKLDQIALVSACGLEEVNRLVTDSPPSDTLITALQEANIQLFVTGYIG